MLVRLPPLLPASMHMSAVADIAFDVARPPPRPQALLPLPPLPPAQ